jgi:ACT domain-containing protein
MEIIRLVEQSPISVKMRLAQLGINRSTYYKWYDRYVESAMTAWQIIITPECHSAMGKTEYYGIVSA